MGPVQWRRFRSPSAPVCRRRVPLQHRGELPKKAHSAVFLTVGYLTAVIVTQITRPEISRVPAIFRLIDHFVPAKESQEIQI